jgi:hypothetical protein
MHRSDDGTLVYGPTIVTEREGQPAVPDRTKVGDISTFEADGQLRAFWRGSFDEVETFLAAVDATALNAQPELRDRFFELVSAVAAARAHGMVAGKADLASQRFAQLPCASCDRPEAAEIRLRCGQVSDVSELELSPLGNPAGCCRRRVIGVMGVPDMPPASPPPRRMGRRY